MKVLSVGGLMQSKIESGLCFAGLRDMVGSRSPSNANNSCAYCPKLLI